ncbi:hypothetical protein TURU_051973 [Turdus rufiventris]|nr:hypothetical protein TURU_051973 [Turdus rufiventris]
MQRIICSQSGKVCPDQHKGEFQFLHPMDWGDGICSPQSLCSSSEQNPAGALAVLDCPLGWPGSNSRSCLEQSWDLFLALPALARPENSDPGNLDPGNSDPGNSDLGNSDPGNSNPENLDPGISDLGNSDPGNLDPGNPDPGNPAPGNTELYS